LLALDAQSVGYDGKPLLAGVNLTLSPGDRVALLGKNGAGKSTCMKMLAGVLPAISGTRSEARDLNIGYFAQHHLEQLKANESALQNLIRVGGARAKRHTEQELRDYLARFGFRGDRVFEAVEPFSGGEKARLMLALVCFQRPNLLLLDEPTNHLDLEMRQALAVALQEYSGAVVLVSHDRHLLNTVADEFRIVHHGRVEEFDGDLEDYAKWLASGAGEPAAAPSAAVKQPIAAPREDAAASRLRKREQAQQRAKLTPLRAAVETAEKELQRLSVAEDALEKQLAAPDLYQPEQAAQLQVLLDKQKKLAQEVDAVEQKWVEATEALERASRD
jgi:ATP-binding cassette subfamily F protein 3